MTRHRQGIDARQIALALGVLFAIASPGIAGAIYTLTDLGPAVGTNVDLFNNSGQITTAPYLGVIRPQDGSYSIESRQISSTELVAFLQSAGQPTTELSTPVGNPQYQLVNALAVNKSGMVVGTETEDGPGFGIGFMYSRSGGMQAVPTPYPGPSTQSIASSVNDAGLIVGSVTAPNGSYPTQRAFLSDGQSAWDLNTLIAPGSGWLLTSAIDINDLGQIVGQGINAQGQGRDYLLTPTTVPEPASLLIVATGILALGARVMAARNRTSATSIDARQMARGAGTTRD